MERYDFHMRLIAASYWARQFTQQIVLDRLPLEFCYDLHTFHDNREKVLRGVSSDEVVENTWQEGKVPIWIDICVDRVERRKTVFRLISADEYESEEHKLFYTWAGSAPFGVKSADLPRVWRLPSQYGSVHQFKFRLCPTFWTRIIDFLLLRRFLCRVDLEKVVPFDKNARRFVKERQEPTATTQTATRTN